MENMRFYIDPTEQYDHGINVPYKKSKAKKFITIPDMAENYKGKGKSELQIHINQYDEKLNDAKNLINNLFL
jgi:hypothetical protein